MDSNLKETDDVIIVSSVDFKKCYNTKLKSAVLNKLGLNVILKNFPMLETSLKHSGNMIS